MSSFIKFTEHNGWEGEVWNFFIQIEGNETCISLLKDIIKNSTDDNDTYYVISEKIYTDFEVNVIIEEAQYMDGYMKPYQRTEGLLDIDKVNKISFEEEREGNRISLYKGGILKLFIN